MALSEGHWNWYGLKGGSTKYLCARFHNCSAHSVWENVNVSVCQDFPSEPIAVTLGEGHLKWYVLKGLATKYHYAKFHDSSGKNVRENVYI